MYFKQDVSFSYFYRKPEPAKANEDSEFWASAIERYNSSLAHAEQAKHIRAFLRASLHRLRKGERVELGYSQSDLIAHIASLFSDGMDWANYGEWEVDHILPIQWFIDNGLTDARIVNSLANLRPLWAKDNRSKGAKFSHDYLTASEFYEALSASLRH
ncbi:hypothetical protein B6T80_23170 [Salmonella enterica subsp. enterica serovar Newport]|nr:hypothetical protein [Salmonella enterica subsp. enterica serovar Newport]